MSKSFETIDFDRDACERELEAFATLLKKPQLSEKKDIQPFFKGHKQISAFIGTFDPVISSPFEFATEFSFLGDFSADLLVGSRAKRRYLVVEFEDGRGDSIFKKVRAKATTEWSRRFDHGCSQLVDWFYTLDDYKKTDKFRNQFGAGHITFSGLLIIGRNSGITDADRARLEWRSEKSRIDSHSISCLTFDDLYTILFEKLSLSPKESKFEMI